MGDYDEIAPLKSYSNDEDYNNYVETPDIYFETLQKISKVATKLRIKEEQEEKKLMDFIPLTERFTLDKENKVLTRWQERQKEWEKIEQLIKKKLTARKGVNRPLMMSTTDEYRAKIEEYDLIQAAMPLKDKFADSAWQMSLRGGGPIIVNVGHIFSGLECKIEPKSVVPKMVRKPKPTTAIFKNDTFIEPSESYLKKVKKYQANLQTIRPHNLTYQEAGNLAITTVDLFQWAKESSEQYLLQEKERLMLTTEEEKEIANEDEDEYLKDISNAASSILAHQKDPERSPKLEFLSSPEVLFEINDRQQESCERVVSFKNTSNITLYYRWKKLEPPIPPSTDITNTATNGTASTANSYSRLPSMDMGRMAMNRPLRASAVEASLVGAVAGGKNKKQLVKSLHRTFDEKVNKEESMRNRILAQERESFFVLNPCGEILPQETITSRFIFTNRTGNAGMFKSSWLLTFLPEETQITLPNDPTQVAKEASSSPSNNSDGRQSPPGSSKSKRSRRRGTKGRKASAVEDEKKDTQKMFLGSLPIYCRGIVTFPDESMTRRQHLQTHFDQSITETMMKDILYEVIRLIRTPIRLSDLQRRKIEYFEQVNRSLLDRIFQDDCKERSSIAYNITIDRVENVEKLSYEVENSVSKIIQLYQELLNAPEVIENQETNPFPSLPYDCKYPFQEHQQQSILQTLFPERKLEIFDEVSLEEIVPHWDYSVNTPLQALDQIQPIILEIEKLEIFIARVQQQKEKERLRQELRAKRKAEGDDDEEEEEEEEEEVEEEDEEAKKRKPKHRLLTETSDLSNAIISEMHKLVAYDLPSQDIYDLTYQAVVSAIDTIFESEEYAIQTAGIGEIITNGGKVTPVESPYSTEAGKTRWETIMNTTSASSEPVDPKKKDKPPAKGAPPPTSLTDQQCDFFHKIFYEKLRENLLASLSASIVSESAPKIQQYLEQTYFTATQSKQTTGQDLSQMATWRNEEVVNQFILYSFPTRLLVPNEQQAYPESAFSIFETQQNTLAKELLELVTLRPRGILLLQETVAPSTSPHGKTDFSFEKQFEAMKERLLAQYTLWKEVDTKQRKKAKIKEAKHYPSLQVIYFRNLAECDYYLSNLFDSGHYLPSSTTSSAVTLLQEYFEQYLPIYFVDNLSYPNVVPIPPEYTAYDSDEEEVAISVGKAEYDQRIRQKWLQSRPHKVSVAFPASNPSLLDETTAATTSAESQKNEKNLSRAIYADAEAALEEIFYLLINGQRKLQSQETAVSSDLFYIEANPQALSNSFSTAYRLGSKKEEKRHQSPNSFSPVKYYAHSLREAILWCSVIQLLPQFPLFQQRLQERLANGETISDFTQPPSYTRLEEHFYQLFPQVVSDNRPLSSLVLLGGELRMDKFKVLDELVTLVDAVYLVGEMALPFIVLFSDASFPNLDETALKYFAVARLLLAKARLCGCALYYPKDLLLAEDSHPVSLRTKCYEQIVADSRSDGADYEGEVKTYPVQGNSPASAYFGYYYDIGKETVAEIQQLAERADLIVVWGTSGLTEVNAFQSSQQAIVQAVTVKPSDDKALLYQPPAKRTLLWGDATVEWFARFLDSDGELQGELVKAGFVSYQNRDSTCLRSLLGHSSSETLVHRSVYREPLGNEWIYSTRVLEAEEEEEEDEEDDEEEEEDN